MRRRRLSISNHLALEVAHAVHRGHRPGNSPPLGLDEPVPGCACLNCVTLARGGNPDDAEAAELLVRSLATRAPEERQDAAERAVASWAEVGCTLPAVGVLVLLARSVPGAVRSKRHRGGANRRPSLPVEEARQVPLFDVVAQLGLGVPIGRWGESRVLCPFHEDENPSLRLNGETGKWYCDPCGIGGDGIRLVELTRGVDFVEAVKTLAP